MSDKTKDVLALLSVFTIKCSKRMLFSRFTPHFLTRVPLKMVRRAGLAGAESISSLASHSPAREARRGQLPLETSQTLLDQSKHAV